MHPILNRVRDLTTLSGLRNRGAACACGVSPLVFRFPGASIDAFTCPGCPDVTVDSLISASLERGCRCGSTVDTALINQSHRSPTVCTLYRPTSANLIFLAPTLFSQRPTWNNSSTTILLAVSNDELYSAISRLNPCCCCFRAVFCLGRLGILLPSSLLFVSEAES
jgi:hypothetical protein